jgi:hypothetical protein
MSLREGVSKIYLFSLLNDAKDRAGYPKRPSRRFRQEFSGRNIAGIIAGRFLNTIKETRPRVVVGAVDRDALFTDLAVDALDGCGRPDAAADDDKAAVAALRASEERQRKYRQSSCFLKIAKMVNFGRENL